MNFPKNDRPWAQALDFAQGHIGPGDSIFAHNAFLQFFPNALPYVFITKKNLKKCDWFVFHKESAQHLGFPISRDVRARFEPVFANENFVIFHNKKSPALKGRDDCAIDRGQVDDLWSRVDALHGTDGSDYWAYTSMKAAYRRPPEPIYFLGNLVRNIFSPKILVVFIGRGGGFFSNFNRVMGHLAHSLHRDGVQRIRVEWHMADIADPDNDHAFPYGRPEDGNLWEHFFAPVSRSGGRRRAIVKTNSYPDPSLTHIYAHYLYKSEGDWRRKYHAVYQKYIRIQPHIQRSVDELYSKYMAGRYVVGVHMRNDAHKSECISGEAVPFDTYVKKVGEILRGRDGMIFLATDVDEIVEQFRAVFGDRMFVQPGVTRSNKHGTEDFEELHQKNPTPHLKMGEDVLIDCLLLARCDALVHTVSNISTAVGYINPDIKMVYCE